MLLKTKVEKELNKIRPQLQRDGGDVELISVDEKTGQVKVKLQGHCAHCPMAEMTLRFGIEDELKRKIPEVKEVIT